MIGIEFESCVGVLESEFILLHLDVALGSVAQDDRVHAVVRLRNVWKAPCIAIDGLLVLKTDEKRISLGLKVVGHA